MSVHVAAAVGNLESLKKLVKTGQAGVNDRDSDQEMPLHCAARSGMVDVVRWLVKQGADVEAKNKTGWAPIHLAALKGHTDVVTVLVKKGNASTETKNDDEDTPLHIAAWSGHLEMVQWLVNHGNAPVEAKNDCGNSPLHDAARAGKLDVVQWLVTEAGARVNARDNDGDTPLHWAAYKGQIAVVQWLVEDGGAAINMANDARSTALHYAARAGKEDVVKWLVESGKADTDALDSKGRTALDLAQSAGRTSSITALSAAKGRRGSKEKRRPPRAPDFKQPEPASMTQKAWLQQQLDVAVDEMTTQTSAYLLRVLESSTAEARAISGFTLEELRIKELQRMKKALEKLQLRLAKPSEHDRNQDTAAILAHGGGSAEYFVELHIMVLGTYMAGRILHIGLMDLLGVAKRWKDAPASLIAAMLPPPFVRYAGVLSGLLEKRSLPKARQRLANLLYGTVPSLATMELLVERVGCILVTDHARSGKGAAGEDASHILRHVMRVPVLGADSDEAVMRSLVRCIAGDDNGDDDDDDEGSLVGGAGGSGAGDDDDDETGSRGRHASPGRSRWRRQLIMHRKERQGAAGSQASSLGSRRRGAARRAGLGSPPTSPHHPQHGGRNSGAARSMSAEEVAAMLERMHKLEAEVSQMKQGGGGGGGGA